MCLVVWLPTDPQAKLYIPRVGVGRKSKRKEGRGRGLSGVSDRDETILPVDEVTIAHFCLHITCCQSMEAWLGWSDPLLPFKTTRVWSVASQESHENCCHQMSDFKAKVHQIRFGVGLCLRPRWGSLQRSPRPP